MNRFQRASQIWPNPAWTARNRQTLTYKHVEQLIGVPAAGIGKLLEPIQSHFLVNGMPPLTTLVVNGETGLPGSGFVGASAEDFGRVMQRVFAIDWLEHGNPQPGT